MILRNKVIRLTLISTALFVLGSGCTEKNTDSTHPWASFKEGSWVDVHTIHRMVMTDSTGEEKVSKWGGDSRMLVNKVKENDIIVHHFNKDHSTDEKATLIVPAIDEFPTTRALGQWPHDIFPMGPERSRLTIQDKNPTPKNLVTKVLKENVKLIFEKKSYNTTLYSKEWDEVTKTGDIRHVVIKAWVAEGIDLPLKWTLTSSDGKGDLESELVSQREKVKIAKQEIMCMVTVTKKELHEGMITKKQWTSTKIPGFMVKMESQLNTKGFSLEIREYITDYSVN